MKDRIIRAISELESLSNYITHGFIDRHVLSDIDDAKLGDEDEAISIINTKVCEAIASLDDILDQFYGEKD